jgi:hypothetical protein
MMQPTAKISRNAASAMFFFMDLLLFRKALE